VDFYSVSGQQFSALFLSFSLKEGVDFYLDRFFGVRVDFYSGMEQTRMVDLYLGGIFFPAKSRSPRGDINPSNPIGRNRIFDGRGPDP